MSSEDQDLLREGPGYTPQERTEEAAGQQPNRAAEPRPGPRIEGKDPHTTEQGRVTEEMIPPGPGYTPQERTEEAAGQQPNRDLSDEH